MQLCTVAYKSISVGKNQTLYDLDAVRTRFFSIKIILKRMFKRNKLITIYNDEKKNLKIYIQHLKFADRLELIKAAVCL